MTKAQANAEKLTSGISPEVQTGKQMTTRTPCGSMKETLTIMTTRYGQTINKTGLTIKARAPQAGWIPQDTTGLGATNMAGTDTFNVPVSKELPPPLISFHRPFWIWIGMFYHRRCKLISSLLDDCFLHQQLASLRVHQGTFASELTQTSKQTIACMNSIEFLISRSLGPCDIVANQVA